MGLYYTNVKATQDGSKQQQCTQRQLSFPPFDLFYFIPLWMLIINVVWPRDKSTVALCEQLSYGMCTGTLAPRNEIIVCGTIWKLGHLTSVTQSKQYISFYVPSGLLLDFPFDLPLLLLSASWHSSNHVNKMVVEDIHTIDSSCTD